MAAVKYNIVCITLAAATVWNVLLSLESEAKDESCFPYSNDPIPHTQKGFRVSIKIIMI